MCYLYFLLLVGCTSYVRTPSHSLLFLCVILAETWTMCDDKCGVVPAVQIFVQPNKASTTNVRYLFPTWTLLNKSFSSWFLTFSETILFLYLCLSTQEATHLCLICCLTCTYHLGELTLLDLAWQLKHGAWVVSFLSLLM